MMTLELWQGSCKVGLLGVLALCNTLVSTLCDSALAQIVPDSTLGNESSLVTPNGNVRGLPATLIEGGATRGVNLLQSFSQFNVGDAQRVYFANPTGIENILTRVTGNNASNILGTLGVNGNANLFLLNPNGIVFGPNASLDVAGSFLATTADSFVFESGLEFSAKNPQAAPLLSVSVTPGLQFGANPGDIRSVANPDPNNANLTVGKNLTLAGGNLDLQRGLQTSEGDISFTASGEFSLKGNQILSFTNSTKGGDINITAKSVSLEGGAILATRASEKGDAGNVNINAQNLTITSGSQVLSQTFGAGNAGTIEVKVDNDVNVTNGALLGSDTSGSGNAGKVSITAKGAVTFDGLYRDQDGNPIIQNGLTSFLPTGAGSQVGNAQFGIPGFGQGGDIEINARSLDLKNGAVLSGITYGGESFNPDGTRIYKNAGNITVKVDDDVNLTNGAQLRSDAVGSSNAGKISITAKGTVTFDGLKPDQDGNPIIQNGSITGASSQVGNPQSGIPSFGQGKDIEINARSLDLKNGAALSSITYGEISYNPDGTLIYNNAGNITVKVDDDVNLTNRAQINSSTLGYGDAGSIKIDAKGGKVFLDNLSFISSEVGNQQSRISGYGQGGEIKINARSLDLKNGAFFSNITFGGISYNPDGTLIYNNAGDVIVNVDDDLNVTNGSQLRSDTYGIGNAGKISITAKGTVTFDGSKVNSGTFGFGKGGNIDITTSSLYLDNGVKLYTLTSGLALTNQQGEITLADAGKITVNVTDKLKILGGSQLRSDTFGQGNAGDITVSAREFSLTSGAQISNITVGNGNPGNITIEAKNGTVLLDNANIFSTIDSGANSISGEVSKISINAGSLELKNNAQIQTVVRGATRNSQGILIPAGNGNAGTIDINVSNAVTLDDVGTAITSILDQETTGTGGDINIEARSLSLKKGAQINASTRGQGSAGSITVKAIDDVSLTGNGTGIFSTAEETSQGLAGNIDIDPKRVFIGNGAEIKVDSNSTWKPEPNSNVKAGSITLVGDQLILNNGKITAETSTVDGGNIILTVPKVLVMLNSSQITTSAVGNGGQILINEKNNRQGILVTVPSQNNDIRANAFGNDTEGGRIEVNTLSVIGFEKEDTGVFDNQSQSEISAKANSGIDGTVSVNSPDVDPASGITTLPVDVVDPSNQIDQGCAAFDEDTAGEFKVTGRGGLPPSPDQPLSSDAVWEDTRTTATNPQNLRANTTAKTPKAEAKKIIPATGWVFKENGEVTLISSTSKATAEKLGSAPQSCPVR
ncbi:filamentous hemagglutinin N-terminal domain-containing protein [Halotia branconii]|uniref:Filamentous hemagglutinin N-terminal domain-containing protein n=1 Tax=Halotia branconii CENA392 TaxID=1539056 RepID=A0AAJ6NPP3_9CYAN|nr:filamentous hemagglutinin N-terminal domain-containing protein [Halotia branconii]WGV24219.1 filamentous hemagglutinin N-terminal domain-containing protein [Halotia branconii CENA392]